MSRDRDYSVSSPDRPKKVERIFISDELALITRNWQKHLALKDDSQNTQRWHLSSNRAGELGPAE